MPGRSGSGRAGVLGSWRWLMLAVAVALLAIGVSIGMLVERWRSAGAYDEVAPRPRVMSPRPVPDRMPQPAVPHP